MTNRPRLNREITGALPNIHGDRFRPDDYLIDKAFAEGILGDVAEILADVPSILSGLVVTNGGSANTVSISSGSALIYDNIVPSITPHDYDGSALTPITIDPYISLVAYAGGTNLSAPASGTTYVKLSLTDEQVLQRGKASNPGSPYDFLRKRKATITINGTLPTTYEYTLAVLTGTYPYSISTVSRTTATKLRIPNNKIKFGSFTETVTSSNLTGDRALILPDRDHQLGAVDPWVTGTKYILNDVVVESNTQYWCISAHTAGTFSTDLATKWIALGGGGGGSTEITVNTAHSFVVGQVVYNTGSVWALAKADSNTTLGQGIISSASVGQFKVLIVGSLILTTGQWDAILEAAESGAGLVPGNYYYTSAANAGKITQFEPVYSNPMLFALSATQALVVQYRPAEAGTGNQVIRNTFTGNGSQTAFVLSAAPSSASYVSAFVGGSIQTDFTLSGTTLTFGTAPSNGTSVIINSIIATTFSTNISQYVQRNPVIIADEASVNVNSNSFFNPVSNGVYEIYDSADPNTYLKFNYKDGSPPDASLRDASLNVVTTDSDGYLCLFISGSNLVLKNRLGSSKTFICHRLI